MKETITQTIMTMSPAFITTAMKIIIISMRRTMRQDMLNPIDTIVTMIRTMNAHRQRIVSKGLTNLCRGLSQ